MHPYEAWTVRRYLANALRSRRLVSAPRPDSDLLEWVERFGRSTGTPALNLPDQARRGAFFVPNAERKAAWRRWRSTVIRDAQLAAPAPSPLQRRVEWLTNSCMLTTSQKALLGVLARTGGGSAASALVAAVNERLELEFDTPRLLEVRPLLEQRSHSGEFGYEEQLFRLGLIESRESLRLSDVVCRILAMKRLDGQSVAEFLLGRPAAASLGWEDFEHLGESRDLAARLIDAADRSRSRSGVNILFYGASGSGKTEFAKTLGARLGFAVQFVGEANDRRGEPSRSDRVAALIIANAIGGVAEKTIVVVDEADDLFLDVDEIDPDARRGSKVFMNRLVERAAAPTIWIVNDIERLGAPVVRRMNLAIGFPRPRARRAIFGGHSRAIQPRLVACPTLRQEQAQPHHHRDLMASQGQRHQSLAVGRLA